VKRAAFVLLAAALCVPVALAANGEPRRKLTKAGQVRARAASLQPADFALGWRHSPAKKNNNQSDPRCSYYNPNQSDLVEIGKYDSPDFTYDIDGSRISSTTGVFRSIRMAKTAYARVARPELARCLAELFKQGAGATNTTVFSAARLRFPSYADRSDAFRIVASVKAPAARVRVYLDAVFVNRGAIDIAVLGIEVAGPLPAALERSLVASLAQRAQ
jgi:hypothetical protein